MSTIRKELKKYDFKLISRKLREHVSKGCNISIQFNDLEHTICVGMEWHVKGKRFRNCIRIIDFSMYYENTEDLLKALIELLNEIKR